MFELHFGRLKQRTRGLRVSRQILDVASMLIDGGERIEDLRQLRGDEGWQRIREREQVMAPRTALDLLYRFDKEDIDRFEKMECQFTNRITKRRKYAGTATIDADETFIEAHKKETEISYHGRPGYYPMLGFLAERAMVIQGKFRQGNESPESKALSFLKKCERSLPRNTIKKRLTRKHGKGKTLFILAHRLGRPVYLMLKRRESFDMEEFLHQLN